MDIAALLDPFGVPCLGSYSGPIWDPFGAHFGSHLGPILGPRQILGTGAPNEENVYRNKWATAISWACDRLTLGSWDVKQEGPAYK